MQLIELNEAKSEATQVTRTAQEYFMIVYCNEVENKHIMENVKLKMHRPS